METVAAGDNVVAPTFKMCAAALVLNINPNIGGWGSMTSNLDTESSKTSSHSAYPSPLIYLKSSSRVFAACFASNCKFWPLRYGGKQQWTTCRSSCSKFSRKLAKQCCSNAVEPVFSAVQLQSPTLLVRPP